MPPGRTGPANPGRNSGPGRIPATFQDGTSNTIVFAEKYSRCQGGGLGNAAGTGGTWWMRGVFHGSQLFGTKGSDDSYPAGRLSAVFGGGRGHDGTIWLSDPASKFVVQPFNPLSTAGACNRGLVVFHQGPGAYSC